MKCVKDVEEALSGKVCHKAKPGSGAASRWGARVMEPTETQCGKTFPGALSAHYIIFVTRDSEWCQRHDFTECPECWDD